MQAINSVGYCASYVLSENNGSAQRVIFKELSHVNISFDVLFYLLGLVHDTSDFLPLDIHATPSASMTHVNHFHLQFIILVFYALVGIRH